MPNELVKSVPIMLDKERNMRFSGYSMMKFEEVSGKNFNKINPEELTAKDLFTLVWACLVHEDKTLTVEQVADFINPANMPVIQDALNNALNPTSLPNG